MGDIGKIFLLILVFLMLTVVLITCVGSYMLLKTDYIITSRKVVPELIFKIDGKKIDTIYIYKK